MARRYAAIMALVGMSVILVRAMKGGDAFEAAIVSALGWMAIFGLIGMVVGARRRGDRRRRRPVSHGA